MADGSILPTSIGVNSQVPIMSMATRLAWKLSERLAHRRAVDTRSPATHAAVGQS